MGANFRRESGAGCGLDLGTFTLIVWFYVGGGRDQMTSTPGLSQADCTSLAAEVGFSQARTRGAGAGSRCAPAAGCCPGAQAGMTHHDDDPAPSHEHPRLVRAAADHDRSMGSGAVAAETGPKGRCDDRGAQSARGPACPRLQLWRPLLVAPQSTRGAELYGLRHCRGRELLGSRGPANPVVLRCLAQLVGPARCDAGRPVSSRGCLPRRRQFSRWH
jgi:hypothetical protein